MTFLIILLAFVLWVASSAVPAYLITVFFAKSFIWEFFVPVFIFLLIIIKSIDSITLSIRKRNKDIATAAAEAERTKYSIVGVNCHKCREMNSVELLVNSIDNKFKCKSCEAENKVLIAFKSIHPASDYTTFNMEEDILDGNIGTE